MFDKFIPYHIHAFTTTIQNTDVQGMKLLDDQIHLLQHHFMAMIKIVQMRERCNHSYLVDSHALADTDDLSLSFVPPSNATIFPVWVLFAPRRRWV